jgi:hypothetical protein
VKPFIGLPHAVSEDLARGRCIRALGKLREKDRYSLDSSAGRRVASVLKTARLVGLGTGTVQRLKRVMDDRSDTILPNAACVTQEEAAVAAL